MMKSLKWLYEFSTIFFPRKNRFLTIVHGWESICGFPEFSGEDPVYHRSKKKAWDWIHWRDQKEQFCFTRVTFPRAHKLPRETLLAHGFLPKRTWVSPGFPSCACPCHLFPAHPLYCFTRCTTEGQWVAGRTVSWAMSETLWRNADPSNCFTGPIRKATHEPLELLHPQIIPASPWVPPTLHIPHSHHCSPTHPKLAPHVHP